MRKFWKQFNSPRNLIVFESAARLNSFTRAADELTIQQPSVSASIKQLEQSLGVSLFYRYHRRVSLTNAGHKLFAAATRVLNDIERTASEIQHVEGDDHVTLNASSAFIYYWVMPRLPNLRASHPDIDLRLQISDREPDLDAEDINLAVRLGTGCWPGYEAVKLANEVIFPVASPKVMTAGSDLTCVADLLNYNLIHLEEPVRNRPTWEDWFKHHNLAPRHLAGGLRLNDYALVLQAAVGGQGVAFGWRHVVESLVQQGLLIACKQWAWETENGIYLIWSKAQKLTKNAVLTRDWISASAEE